MKRFLIVHLYSNGDCLYATTLARQLKNDFPGCQVTWAIAPFCSAIISNNPFVDSIWTIDYITDRKMDTFRANRNRLFSEAAAGGYDRIFFTQLIEENMRFYDGLVRTSIFSACNYPITVPVQPVLELLGPEKKKVVEFVANNGLSEKDYVILFECSPQSGQLAMTNERALGLAKKIIAIDPQCKIILSSQHAFTSGSNSIIDGSVLTLRETAHLTHSCNLLIGCSSGITWSSTSSAAKSIPSIQLLDKNAYIFNSPVLDHQRMHLPADRWLELFDFDDDLLLKCIQTVRREGFSAAKNNFGQSSPQTFRLFRGIIHRFIQERKFAAISFFIRNNYKIHGFNIKMTWAIGKGFVLFPAQWVLNRLGKKRYN